jgi:hypothetical protein
MKKIIPILLIGMLVFSGLGAVALDSDEKQFEYKIKEIENTENGARDFTHTVLAEYMTSTTCGYCKHAHAALKNIYASGDYPFYYVSFVSNKNPGVCNPRRTELNNPGYPDVYFDGGYIVEIGGYTGNEADYRVAIPACGNRAVYDVDVNLNVTWLGGTNMQINASVDNNEGNTYDGTIRVYITEIISSMNWRDTASQLYTFPLLDFAFKDDGTGNDISISAGGTWSDSTTWDGTAHGFSSITRDNIMVIAAVFNDDWHQGYAYPPSQNPFDAYYVDDTIGTTPSGGQPEDPDLDCAGTLSWTDVEPGATVTGTFTVENIGDSLSLLDWEIESYPDWGTFTFDPDGGLDLTPEAGAVTVTVDVVAPEDPETEFEGEIVLVNSEDPDDICIIDVALATPVSQQSLIFQFFEMLAERFPFLALVLEVIF